jgi:hypothetical protein
MPGVHARTLAVMQNARLPGSRKDKSIRSVVHFLQKIDRRDGRNAVFASSHLRDVDAGANHARAWALTAAASPRKEERQS